MKGLVLSYMSTLAINLEIIAEKYSRLYYLDALFWIHRILGIYGDKLINNKEISTVTSYLS